MNPVVKAIVKPVVKAAALLVGAVLLIGVGLAGHVLVHGVSARDNPGIVETFLARSVRTIAIGWRARDLSNPVERTAESLAEGRGHYADHCAGCHGNDGSGDTELGRGLSPKAPDMRLDATQVLSDGELFYIIENGIRFTGMPAWGTGTKESGDATWHLVHFIRHLPAITRDELAAMEQLNPKPAAEWREQAEIETFLKGGDSPSGGSPAEHEHHAR